MRPTFEKHYLKPAEYVDGRKVAAVRSISPAMAAVKALQDYFGKRQLRDITHSDIRAFRAESLATKTKAGKQALCRCGQPGAREASFQTH